MCVFVARGASNKPLHCKKHSTGQRCGIQLGMGTQDTNVRACMLRMRLTNNLSFLSKPSITFIWAGQHAQRAEFRNPGGKRKPPTNCHNQNWEETARLAFGVVLGPHNCNFRQKIAPAFRKLFCPCATRVAYVADMMRCGSVSHSFHSSVG